MENELQLFSNSDLGQVRVVLDENNEPWFVAKDVAQSLGYRWNDNSCVRHIPNEWKDVKTILTPQGKQGMMTLSKQGIYLFFLSQSDKLKALPFHKWVADEIIPKIRKVIDKEVDF